MLHYNNNPWFKNNGNEEFDVVMGCYDGAEICELIDCYILNQLSSVFRNDFVRLCRDGDLGNFKNMLGPEVKRKHKDVINVYENCRLKSTIKTDLAPVDFLEFC